MAKSGSLTTNSIYFDYCYYSLSFSWSIKSQSITDNTTTINYSVTFNGDSTWVYGKSLGVTINGVWHGTDGTWTKRNRGTIASGTQVIKHNASGNATVSASVSGRVAYNNSNGNMSKSGSWSLPTIARTNTITSVASTLIVGDWWSIYVDKKSTSTTTSLRYQIKQPNGSWTAESDGVISSSWDSANKRYKWIITGETAKKVEGQLAGQASAKVKITAITTYNGSEIGRSSVERTLNSGKSTISMPESTIGNTATISVKRAYNNDSLTSIVYQRFASEGWTKIKDIGTGTSCTWELSPELHNKIPKAKSGTWEIAAETYSEGIKIGTNYYNVKLNANSSLCSPTLSPKVIDTNTNLINNFTGDANTLVRYESDAAITIGASAKYGATITDKWAWDYVNTLYKDGTLNDVNGGEFEFYAKDSRGFEVRQVVKKNVISYIKPTCVIDVPNPDTQGNTTLHIEGQFFNGNFGIIDNVITVQYIIMQGDTIYQTWKQVDIPASKGNKYSVDVLIEDLDYTKPYKIKAQAIDLINQISSNEKTIRTLPVFDWGEDDFNFNVPVKFSNGINGVISLENGGTGAINGTDALNNLGLNDYVIERGEYTIKNPATGPDDQDWHWYWEKYNSGKCTAKIIQWWKVEKWTAWGTGFSSTPSTELPMPPIFKSIDYIQQTVTGGNSGDAYSCLSHKATEHSKVGRGYVIRPNAGKVGYYARRWVTIEGVWK